MTAVINFAMSGETLCEVVLDKEVGPSFAYETARERLGDAATARVIKLFRNNVQLNDTDLIVPGDVLQVVLLNDADPKAVDTLLASFRSTNHDGALARWKDSPSVLRRDKKVLLGLLKKHVHTYDISKVLKENGEQPLVFTDVKFIIQAMRQCRSAFDFADPSIITEDFIINSGLSDVLLMVPRNLRTARVCRLAMAHCRINMFHVPLHLFTASVLGDVVGPAVNDATPVRDLVFSIIRRSPKSFEHISFEVRKAAPGCDLEAVSLDGDNLKYIEANCITRDIALAAVTHNGKAVRWLPRNLLTDDICAAAVAQNRQAKMHIAKMLRE